jgi:hypothetical protein
VANVWLTMKEAEVRRGDWLDPDAGKILFGTYSDIWINDLIMCSSRAQKSFTEDCSRITCGRLSATRAVDLADVGGGDTPGRLP